MTEWQLPNIFAYWDERTRSVSRLSQRLSTLTEDHLEAAIKTISETIAGQVSALPDDELQQVACVVADDLYKASGAIEVWDASVESYLQASAAPFFSLLRDRGYVLHYLVDNSVTTLDRPFLLLPPWCAACGMVYICPQHLASKMMEKDGIKPARFGDELPRYISEGRHTANLLVERCANDSEHFLLLDIDYEEGSFAAAHALEDAPGVITAFRNEAPVHGTNIQMHLAGETVKPSSTAKDLPKRKDKKVVKSRKKLVKDILGAFRVCLLPPDPEETNAGASKDEDTDKFADAEAFKVCLVNESEFPIENIVIMQSSYSSDGETTVVLREGIRELGTLPAGSTLGFDDLSASDLDFVHRYWIDLRLGDQEAAIALEIDEGKSLTADTVRHIPFGPREESQVILADDDTRTEKDRAMEVVSSRLRNTLPGLLNSPVDSHMIVSLVESDNYFVQFAVDDDEGLIGEAVSNSFLATEEQLNEAAQKQLLQMGWEPPEVDSPRKTGLDSRRVNYYRIWKAPVPIEEAVDLAVQTAFEVYGAKDSWEFAYELWRHEEHA